ncbi:MAG TPA: MgtC/SapB family protein [Actinomycetota bacterium]|nr:MgtC/SapB family protein [Actinomycetota bacterium]
MLSDLDLVLRVLGAALLGGLIGVEREINDQAAGFRTHIVVSLGAALFTMAGAYGVEAFVDRGLPVRFDPTRVAAQIVTGIGFLGAGVIIQRGLTVRGLTTAAALWLTAAIGTAVGLGYWTGAIATTTAALVALYGLKWFEQRVLHRLKRGRLRLVVETEPGVPLASLVDAVEGDGATVHSARVVDDEPSLRRSTLVVRLRPGVAPDAIADRALAARGVTGVDWTA